MQEAVADAQRSLANSDEAAQVGASGASRAAAASEAPLHTQLAGIAQLCDAAREAWALASDTYVREVRCAIHTTGSAAAA